VKLEKRAVFGWPATAAGYAPCDQGLVVHYDGSDQGLAGRPHQACRQYWKNTRKFHMNSRGWADIGYSFAVCPHGIVLEGRGWQRVQAAQPGGNTTWTSVTFMSGPNEAPTAGQIRAFKELRAWLRGKGLGSGIRGHRDFISTSCPGDRLYRMVRDGTLTGAPAKNWTEDMVKKLPTLGKGAKPSEDMQTLRSLLLARSHPEVGGIEGGFDATVERAVKAVQKWGGVEADGIVGPQTWPVLLRVHT